MAEERVCEGYKIIDSVRVGEVEVLLGHSLTAPQPYVTWKAYEHSNYEDFAHGHYCDTMQQARIDFYDRIKDAWVNYSPAKDKAQNAPRKDKPHKQR
ncbi:MAG: hypothetical protein IJV64_12490 [Oscillospiraceae bacterium]|nr:hypothetical protein [Oscillospiraceae bacterium]